jgi:acyl carrier protein
MSNDHPIFSIIYELIENKDIKEINCDTDLDDLDLDSLDTLDLQMEIQKRLNYDISLNQLIESQKINDLIKIIES